MKEWQTILAWPEGRDLRRNQLPQWIAQLRDSARERGATHLAERADAVVRDFDNPDGLYDLGYVLIDAGAPAIAATILWHCLALVGDSEEVVCELVSALESALAYEDAFAILERHAALRERSFLCAYLYAFNAAMTGRLDIVRAQLPGLTPEEPETEGMRDTIAAIVERADRVAGACPLDARDLRGWHYVLSGGLLMQAPTVASAIDRLVALVRAVPVPCVYAPVGPHHESLATAIAAALAVPVAPWPAVGTPAPGLIVAHDLADIPETELVRLAQRKPEQIFFVHGVPCTRDSPVAPDVTAVLYGAGDHLADDAPAGWGALVSRAWPLAPGARSRLWAGGPVLCSSP